MTPSDAALPSPGAAAHPGLRPAEPGVGPETPAGGPREASPSFTRRAALTAGAAAGLTGLYMTYAATVTPLLRNAAEEARRATDRRENSISPPASNRALAERYLPHAPFAAEAKYQVGSGQSMMYWNEWAIEERASGKSALRVTPFAAVIVDDSGADPEQGGKQPTTVMANTAVLWFAKPISEDMVSNPGRVVVAGFYGDVRIDGAEGLRVAGSNFLFLEGNPASKYSRLYSDSPVSFRHGGSGEGDALTGGHEGAGVGVDIKLFRTRTPGSYENVAADGLQEVAVRGPVALTLRDGRLPGLDAAGGPLGKAPTPDLNDPADAPREPVEITATRQLVFDPLQNTALFTSIDPGGVRASRPQPAGTVPETPEQAGPDELICDDLLVRFAPATDEAKAEAAALRAAMAARDWGERPFYAADDDLEATAVVANGAPVRVNSPSRQITTTSARLEHDVPADVLTLSGRSDAGLAAAAASDAAPRNRRTTAFRGLAGSPENSAGPDLVRVTLPDATILCPRLVVTPPDAPAGVDPATIDAPRRVRCTGPGLLLRNDPETGELAARVKWPGSLVTARNARTGRDVITLTGPANPQRNAAGHTELADQVLVQTFADGSELAADHVVLELEPNPHADATPNDPKSNMKPGAGGPLAGADPMGGSVRPAKAIATGSVRMKGPELLAGAKQVDVRFVDPAPRPAPPPVAAAAPGAAASPAEAAPPAAEPVEEAPPGPPKKFYSDAVVATIVRARTENGVEVEKSYISQAVATGQVGLYEEAAPPTEPGGEPGEARYAKAAKAVLTGAGPEEQLLTLFGAPATATAPPVPAELNGSGADLTGPEIRFDPQQNTAVVVGAGSLDLPVRGGGMPGFTGSPDARDAASPASPAPADPSAPARKSVRVDWGESMTFDGSVATFYGGARTLFHGTEGQENTPSFTEDTVRLYCNLMTVTLTKKVVFGSSLPGAGETQPDAGDDGDGDAEIKLITCHGRVNVRGRQDAPDPRAADPLEPREAQRVEGDFAQLEVLWKTGDFTAQGIGEMKVWRRDDQAAAPETANGTVRPNARGRRLVALPCELIHVAFKREVRGNLNGPDAIFHPNSDARVEVVHGPVRDFGVELLPTPGTSLPAGASRMVSRRLELRHVPAEGAARGPDGEADLKTRELFASGDVTVDGHGEPSGGRPGAWYWADAPRATYNEAKGRLELSGTADGLVQLYRANSETGPRDLATGRSVTFYPDVNRVVMQEVQGADGLP